jgi:hypothetical protein
MIRSESPTISTTFEASHFLDLSEFAYSLWKASYETANGFEDLNNELSSIQTMFRSLSDDTKPPQSALNRRGLTCRDERHEIPQSRSCSETDLSSAELF